MKMSRVDYVALQEAASLLMEHPNYVATRRAYADLKLSDTRFVWDAYHATKLGERREFQAYNDAHIEAAMRRALGIPR